MSHALIVRQIAGLVDYDTSWQAMRDFTNQRDTNSTDEAWLLEHPPVFTQGQAGKPEHVLNPGNIPIVQTDRGGQVTYHGPGQLMLYLLADIRRLKIRARGLVMSLEQTVIDTLAEFDIKAAAKRDAPGVYVDDKKICSIGLRIRRGCSYHGIAFNIENQLDNFKRINPCGFEHLQMTCVNDFGFNETPSSMQAKILPHLLNNFGYSISETCEQLP